MKKIIKLLRNYLICPIAEKILPFTKFSSKAFQNHNPQKKLIGFTSFPYKGHAAKLKGGDATVEGMLKEVFISNGYIIKDIKYDTAKIRFGKFFELILGVPFVYSKIINHESLDCWAVICGSEVLWDVHHPRCVALFHISYQAFLEKVVIEKEPWNIGLFGLKAMMQKQGTLNTINIAVSDILSQDLMSYGIHVDRVIHNCVDVDFFKPLEYENRQGLVFAGAFSWYAKGFDVLEKIAELNSNHSVYCVTNGAVFNSKLIFQENIPLNQMPDKYNQHKILLFPSRYESFGLVPIEALACGVPIIMNSVGVASDLKSIEPIFVVQNNDPEEYNLKIVQILNNYDYYSKKAREIAEMYFSKKVFAERWLNLLKEI